MIFTHFSQQNLKLKFMKYFEYFYKFYKSFYSEHFLGILFLILDNPKLDPKNLLKRLLKTPKNTHTTKQHFYMIFLCYFLFL